MSNIIAIRKENIEPTEQRSPLSPAQIGKLKSQGVQTLLEPWENRRYTANEYTENGALLSTDLSKANVIFGVKEVPVNDLVPGKPHCFFSHTIKGQSYNMPLLQAILDKKVTLMDYEKITDDTGRRLVFFGPYAGIVGAINTLWLLGKRLALEGLETPFNKIRQANSYASLKDAEDALDTLAAEIRTKGLPDKGRPWVVAITGGGTVSGGAQKIIDRLPLKAVSPKVFRRMQADHSFDPTVLYKVVIDCDNFVKPIDPTSVFEWDDYFAHPEKYQADFAGYLPDITALINGIYWERRYPRLITKNDIKQLYGSEQPNLRVISDITCDVQGSIECNLHCTASDNPVYVYLAETDEAVDGIEGWGPVILAVDKLPSELPREATTFFGEALMPYVADLASADFTKPFEALDIPAPMKRAVIAHQGRLTPSFEYLRKFL